MSRQVHSRPVRGISISWNSHIYYHLHRQIQICQGMNCYHHLCLHNYAMTGPFWTFLDGPRGQMSSSQRVDHGSETTDFHLFHQHNDKNYEKAFPTKWLRRENNRNQEHCSIEYPHRQQLRWSDDVKFLENGSKLTNHASSLVRIKPFFPSTTIITQLLCHAQCFVNE
jgi:hypothetical protein